MNLSRPFIQRPVFTTLLMVTLITFGLIAYQKLPVSSIPQVEYPVIEVSAVYPGASPDDIANLVAGPLEREFIIMQGIDVVSSQSYYGNCTIILQFHLGVNIDIAAQEVEQAIQKALAQLPKDIPQNPTYTKVNPADTPIMYLAIHSPLVSPWEVYEYGYSYLGQQLGTVDGIAEINTFGYPYAVRCHVNPQKLAAKNISFKELTTAIDNANVQQPTGKIYGPETSVVIQSNGQLTKAEEYKDLIVKYNNGAPVRLKDVATVEDGLENDKSTFRWYTKETPDGENICFLAIFRQLGYNTVEACTHVENLVAKLEPQIPKNITLTVPFSLKKWILESLDDVKNTLYIAFALIVIVIYLYLGRIRNSLIPLLSLPITIVTSFIFMKIFGYSIDIISLSAITIAIGFLVDDAIIVMENIVRVGQTDSLNAYEASIKGSKQIVLVIVAMSLSLCAVFIPMLFLEGVVGQIFHEMSAVIIITVLVSGFISLSLTPMLCSRFLVNFKDEKKTKIELLSERLNNFCEGKYETALHYALKHKILVLGISALSMLLSGYLFVVIPKDYLPENDLGVIQGFPQMPEGTSPEAFKEEFKQLTKVGLENPYVEFMAAVESFPTDNQGLLFYNLVDANKRPSVWELIKGFNEKNYMNCFGTRTILKAMPLINLQVGSVTAGKAAQQYILRSFDQNALTQSSEKLISSLRSSPYVKDVSTDYLPNAPQLKLNFLRNQSHSYGNINGQIIEDTLKYAYGETYISKINVPQNMYYVIMDMEQEFNLSAQNFSSLYMANNPKGAMVSLNSVTESKISSGTELATRVNALPSVTISFNTEENVPLSTAVEEVNKLAKEVLPDNVTFEPAGNTAAFAQAIAQFVGLILLAIFVIYIILGILYENFIHPLTAISNVPVALLGGILSLMITGNDLSIYALIGILMLLGIVMKNGILIIDFTLEIIEGEKLSAKDAVFKACTLRFRPIVMTTIAAMMGAVPIALGIGGSVARSRAPLGIAIVGGLIFAQIVTLFVTPIVFIYIHKLNTYLTQNVNLFKTSK
ncbi:MAG: Multidrug resistance protein MdtB [Chlamydiia bacterium]|nr:Multidrug resistance protein MdtB [Chlamydiia bacterium]